MRSLHTGIPGPSASLDAAAVTELAALDARDRRRTPPATRRGDGALVERNGRPLLDFCSNDYLGLARDPEVVAAAADALHADGAGAGGSALVGGRHPLGVALERQLAAFKRTDDAVLFGSGFLANTGVAGAIARAGDLILIDALAHASMWAGARAGGAELVRFAHNDVDALRALLTEHRGRFARALVMSEGVFSMDGDRAPLAALAACAREYDAWLYVDDAHAIGVIGDGRGSVAAAGLTADDVPLQVGTLSKALGGYGAYLAASAPVAAWMRNRARTYVFSTALPSASAAAALAALRIIAREPQRVARPLALARRFCSAVGLSEPQSAIVPLVVGAEADALACARRLEDAGYYVAAIRPPSVPEGTSRLRFSFSALHRESDVDALAGAVRALRA